MEKLQKALKKAREEREGSLAPQRPSPQGRDAPHVGSEDVWQRLTPLVPDPDHLLANQILSFNEQRDSAHFEILRTKVFLMMQRNNWTRIAMISPDKGCGKTTLACNLAMVFSRQRQVKSILLDLDLRQPGVARAFGQTPPHDVVDVLTGAVSPADQMMRLRDNVAVAMSARPAVDPSQILLAPKSAQVLDMIQSTYAPDAMIFDLPPMMVTDDAHAVLKNVDCALIVARAEQTTIAQLDVCEREVGEYTNVLGVVLNDCRLQNQEDTYEVGYG